MTKCVECIYLGEKVPCSHCGGYGYPCIKSSNGQHVHPDYKACHDFKSKDSVKLNKELNNAGVSREE